MTRGELECSRSGRTLFVNRDPGGYGASSSNGAGSYASGARTQRTSRGVAAGSSDRHDLRGHPSCGSRGDVSRRRESEPRHPAPPRPRWDR